MVNTDGVASRMSSGADAPALLATADEGLLDDLLRLAAAAGVTPQIESDLVGVRRSWQTASMVVVGRDFADLLAGSQPVRRPGVVVVGDNLDDPAIYRCAVAIGAEQVCVLPAEEAVLAEKLADTVDGASRSAVTLACVGGCGGAGASMLAAALGMTGARRGLRTMLIDGDPLGGGIDLVVGGERGTGLRWPDLVGTAGRINATALRSALPNVDRLAVLSWDRDDVVRMPPEAMRSVLDAAQRSNDLVVLDLPRWRDEAVEEALTRTTSTLLVVPRDVRSCAAAARVAKYLAMIATDLRIVTRDPAINDLTADDVAAHVGGPLAAQLRFDKDLTRLVDAGHFAPEARTPLGRVSGELLDHFGLYGRAAG